MHLLPSIHSYLHYKKIYSDDVLIICNCLLLSLHSGVHRQKGTLCTVGLWTRWLNRVCEIYRFVSIKNIYEQLLIQNWSMSPCATYCAPKQKLNEQTGQKRNFLKGTLLSTGQKAWCSVCNLLLFHFMP